MSDVKALYEHYARVHLTAKSINAEATAAGIPLPENGRYESVKVSSEALRTIANTLTNDARVLQHSEVHTVLVAAGICLVKGEVFALVPESACLSGTAGLRLLSQLERSVLHFDRRLSVQIDR